MGMIVGNQEIIGCIIENKLVYEANKLVYEADPVVTVQFMLQKSGEIISQIDVPFVANGSNSQGQPIMDVTQFKNGNGQMYVESRIPGGYTHNVFGDDTWQNPKAAKTATKYAKVIYLIKENAKTTQINVQFINQNGGANLWSSIDTATQNQFATVSKDAQYQILQGQKLTNAHVEDIITVANMRQIVLNNGKTAYFIRSDSTTDTSKEIVPVNAYYEVGVW